MSEPTVDSEGGDRGDPDGGYGVLLVRTPAPVFIGECGDDVTTIQPHGLGDVDDDRVFADVPVLLEEGAEHRVGVRVAHAAFRPNCRIRNALSLRGCGETVGSETSTHPPRHRIDGRVPHPGQVAVLGPERGQRIRPQLEGPHVDLHVASSPEFPTASPMRKQNGHT
ncbi:hypothetical protein RM446_01710 [Streptomonospora sp. DSM 45055]|uniref:Uncharacterized protein n=1 Tax=Streptomonospora wellingtoniae TaxID=3075544 RepID=A0ABU2KNI2_9ACTN|nr:hypothetical protein [Streptomonospora sp. DSM 45055]MDT0300825.1 hypothetical protein [Streptomonospora sp. DSM 45055]